jgi:hypothetical protein
MNIVCSTCAITGNRICLHISVGDREQEGESMDSVWAQFQRQERGRVSERGGEFNA